MQHEPAQLLVIDEDDSTDAIIPILEQCGYNLTVLADVSAIGTYKRTEFDVIIRGSTACQSNTPLSITVFRNTPVLVVTSSNDMDEVIKCLDLGAKDYIGLPFHPTVVKARVDGYLERVKLRKNDNFWVSLVAHEVKMPIVSIRGYAEILTGNYEQQLPESLTDEQKKRFAEIILRYAVRLQGWVSNIVDIVYYESGARRGYFETIPVGVVIQSVIQTLQSQIAGKEQTLVLEIPQHSPDIRSEPSRLEQVISTLVCNANLYTPQGGQIRITVDSDPSKDFVHVAVSDNGIGIAPENQPKIFQPFFRVYDDPRVSEVFGYGLGLAIAKGIIEAHGGRIWFESTPGVGSTFHFTLPVALN